MIEQTNEVRVDHDIYPAIAKNITKGWPGSGFKTRFTEMSVRRIPAGKGGSDTKEHVQIEISIDEVKGDSNRLYRHSGALVLTPAQVEQIVAALKHPVNY